MWPIQQPDHLTPRCCSQAPPHTTHLRLQRRHHLPFLVHRRLPFALPLSYRCLQLAPLVVRRLKLAVQGCHLEETMGSIAV